MTDERRLSTSLPRPHRRQRPPSPVSRRGRHALQVAVAAALTLVTAACGGGDAIRSPTGGQPSPTFGAGIAAPGVTDLPNASDPPGAHEYSSMLGNRPTVTYLGGASWQIQRPSTADHPTEAYADAPSYLPGGTLRLAVSTDAPTYTVAIFRVGATVQAMGDSGPQPGLRQGGPTVDPITKMVRAAWSYTYSQPIPVSWSSGLYVAKVSGQSGTQSYASFVVRSARASRFLFVSNTLDYEAYNRWGGSSLYWTGVGDPAPGVHQAFAVSLDRPFASQAGAGQPFTMEAPFIAWLERHGYDVTYTTDYDLSTHPQDQPLPTVVLFSGHGEYWGEPLRDWLDLHVNRIGDMGLGMFASDTGYWRVRFNQPTATGPRSIVLYKNALYDPSIHARCPGGYTRKADSFRWLPCGVADPRNRPQQALFGVHYGSIVPGYNAYRLARGATSALLARTGLQPGDSLGNIAGGEVDQVPADTPRLPGNLVLAEASGLVTRNGEIALAQAVVRVFPSGGRVFASGTFWWGWGLERDFAGAHGVPAGFSQLTINILAFLAGQ